MLFIYTIVLLSAAAAISLLFVFTPSSDCRGYSDKPLFSASVENIRALAKECREDEYIGNGVSIASAKRDLRRACAVTIRKSRSGKNLSRPEEVLFDGFYKINELIVGADESVHKLKGLPSYRGLPIVYRLCVTVLHSCGGEVDEKSLRSLVGEFNAYRPLSSSEALAFPAAMNVALLSYVARLARRLIAADKAYRSAVIDAAAERVDISRIKSASYITTLYGLSSAKLKREIAELCLNNGADVEKTCENYSIDQAVTASSLTASLELSRALSELLSDELCLSLTPVNGYLLRESSSYAQSVAASKKIYLEALSRKARREKRSELSLAEKLSAMPGDVCDSLLPRRRGRRIQRLFVTAELLAVVILCVTVGLLSGSAVAAIIAFPILVTTAFSLTCRIFSGMLRKRVLPKKSLSLIPNDKRVNIICTRLIASEEEIRDAVNKLKAMALLQPGDRYSYTLLVDFCGADEQKTLFDARLIRLLKDEFKDVSDKFNLLVRRRSPNKDGKWEGREKKRGALSDCMALMLKDEREPFELIVGSSFCAEYALVVDSDTLLSCGDELLQVMEHPYNRSVNVLSLSMTSLLVSTEKTIFSQIFSGHKGISSYCAHHDDFIYDAFGAANFTGKGMIRVKEFYEATHEAFPSESILSHDFIEGAFAGAAQSDEEALDEFPPTFFAFFSRSLRWLRGDVQLFPYLFSRVVTANGKRIKNPLLPIEKWHVFYNIIDGLVPIASLLLCFLTVLKNDERLLLIALLPYAIGFFLAPKSVLLVLCRLAFLPVQAIYNFYAIALTFIRLLRHKHLLEWQVFAHQKKGEFTPLPCSVTAFLLLTADLFLSGSYFVYGLCALFVLAIPLEGLLAQEKKAREIPARERELLSFNATRTWEFFKLGCIRETSYLPPDNFCDEGERGFAYRTSPTNIGMAIASAYSAYKLGIIERSEAQAFVGRLVRTVERLEKWNGNLYNWYDIKTLEVLYPRYVSSVDSGNFVCTLYLAQSLADDEDKKIIERLIAETKLSAFYDAKKGLMRIGFCELEKRFDAYYDLVASEASVLYLLAISRGEIPSRSWTTLSRRAVKYSGVTLYSWTGGSFEQLFCPLFFKYAEKSIYERSCRAMIKAQVKYAKKRGLPVWGISESGYDERNESGDYKYKAFGVPSIALSSSGAGTVVAPYACALALGRYRSAASNLYAFSELGMFGKLGLYEAYDGRPVKSYMAHHQGMIMAATCNYLCDAAIVTELSTQPVFVAAQLPLSDCGRLRGKKKPTLRTRDRCAPETLIVRGRYEYPVVGLYGRRKYRFAIDERGNGYSMYCGDTVLRRRENVGFKVFINGKSAADGAEASFTAGGAEYRKKENGISSVLTAQPLMRLDGEKRTLVVRNCTSDPQVLRISALAEPVLGSHDADVAHREYGNMFVKLEERVGGVVATRAKGSCVCAFTAFCSDGSSITYEGNRARFFERRDGLRMGETLDPALAAHCELTLESGRSVTLEYLIVAAQNEKAAAESISLIRSYGVFRTADEQGTLSSVHGFSIAGRIISARSCVKGPSFALRFDPRYPMIALTLSSARAAQRLRAILSELKAIVRYGIKAHIAILLEEEAGYHTPLRNAAFELISDSGLRELMPPELALLTVNGACEPELYELIDNNSLKLRDENTELQLPPSVVACPARPGGLKKPELAIAHGKNGFLSDGSYFIDVSDGLPPKPWSNIISNADFGTLLTESGGGYTFSKNAGLERITEWTNDSTLDPPSEFILLSERGLCWSVTCKPIRTEASYHVIHSFGYTKYSCDYNGFLSRLTCFIGRAQAKYYMLELENVLDRERSVAITLACRLTLGDFAERTKTCITTKKEENVLRAHNVVNGKSIMLDCSEKILEHSFSISSLGYGDRLRADGYVQCSGTDLVYTVNIHLLPKQSKRVIFCLTETEKYDFSIADELLEYSYRKYSSLSAVQMRSDVPELDFLYRWLPYQVLSSRYYGRTGFYQSSGAYGFRDQLQDCMALLYVDTKLVRRHILMCSEAQFERGDVLHWWHEGNGGVRTHISDDRLFLPWATCEYIDFTGDAAILTEKTFYLKDDAVPHGERSLYKSFEKSSESESLLKHCLRAIRSVELSDSSMPLLGGGDWNDAMDEAGTAGRGESVFLGMLLCLVIKRFMRFVTDERDRSELVLICERVSCELENRWDGDRYQRATTDDGIVLGSNASPECKTELLSQAFAVLSGACDRERAKTAMSTADEHLVDRENGIVKLLEPPFKTLDVGYITDYPAGIRENGGQYTHAAIWYIAALYELGMSERAYEALSMIAPYEHARNEKYGLEPYVMAADIYDGKHAGEGGWSWYTGAAGWAYKTITEKMLGVKIRKRTLTLEPKLPDKIKRLTLTVTVCGNRATIEIDNTGSGEWQLYVGKVRYGEPTITVNERTEYSQIRLVKE